MKLLLLISLISLILLSSCTRIPATYVALSCDRMGCVELYTFYSLYECQEFLEEIHELHTNVLKSHPTRILNCEMK